MAEENIPTIKPHKATVIIGMNGHIETVTVTIKCPYCGEEHIHGFGTGHRVSHCGPGKGDNSGYYLDCKNFSGTVEEYDKRRIG